MKTIDISRMGNTERALTVSEVRRLSSLKHPFIVSYGESFIEGGLLCILMDHAEGGDLQHRIQKLRQQQEVLPGGDHAGWLPELQVLRWFAQAALATKYMHENQVLHRDLKSQSCFLAASGRLRIGDFGISQVLENNNAARQAAFSSSTSADATTVCSRYHQATPNPYMSPEVCWGKPYGETSDIWALGCILYEMMALSVLFDASNTRLLVEKITRGPVPVIPTGSYSAEIRRLCSEILQREPGRRPSAAQIASRPVLQAEIRRMLREEQARRPPQYESVSGMGDALTPRSWSSNWRGPSNSHDDAGTAAPKSGAPKGKREDGRTEGLATSSKLEVGGAGYASKPGDAGAIRLPLISHHANGDEAKVKPDADLSGSDGVVAGARGRGAEVTKDSGGPGGWSVAEDLQQGGKSPIAGGSLQGAQDPSRPVPPSGVPRLGAFPRPPFGEERSPVSTSLPSEKTSVGGGSVSVSLSTTAPQADDELPSWEPGFGRLPPPGNPNGFEPPSHRRQFPVFR